MNRGRMFDLRALILSGLAWTGGVQAFLWPIFIWSVLWHPPTFCHQDKDQSFGGVFGCPPTVLQAWLSLLAYP
jgi:hypothetical protein